MSFREGHRCPDESCGCELTMTKAVSPTCAGRQSPPHVGVAEFPLDRQLNPV